ncbi:MAG TPA: multiheme c-type cytochrome [Kofleriaceae bacterium]|nr:multiheme c-type cytochrome [Kofleriaceae bacterium]
MSGSRQLWVGLAMLAACGGSTDPAAELPPAAPEAAPAPDAADLHAVIPHEPGRFAPSQLELAADARISGKHLTDYDTCGSCHQEIQAEWETSAHAFASFNNPVYRSVVDRFRDEQGGAASRFCAGCHDIALMVDGRMDADGPIAASDGRAHAGVTCRMCHGITQVRSDGNGAYTLAADPLPIPREGDAESLRTHVAAVKRDAFGATLCTTTCHRAFLGADTGNQHHLVGQEDVTPWQSSAYTGNGLARIDDVVEKKDCLGCHMGKEKATLEEPAADDHGMIASHRFLGGHTWLAAMRGDADALARDQKFLQGVASIDVATAVTRAPGAAPVISMPADGAPAPAGATLTLDVVVRNLMVGHRFPTGVLDAQDTWIEVVVRDHGGRVLAASGSEHAYRDDDAHVLRVLVAGADGRPRFERQVNQFRGRVADHTVAPRDAEVARYQAELPRTLPASAYPLAVEARLLHRTRNALLAHDACAATRSPRGREFAHQAPRFKAVALDGCVAQPVTEIARARVELGPGARVDDTRPRWRRLYEHGMGLLATVQEELEQPRASLTAALAAQEAAGIRGGRERAMILTALARVAGRQGRTQEALDWAAAAEREVPGAPALARIRADALMRVWRWDEAVAPLQQATTKAPLNLDAWSALAMTLGSLGRDREALAAAQHGLALAPRDSDCLRVQAVALRALGSPEADRALAAYDAFRPPDWAAQLRIDCVARDAECARERTPVHVHALAPPR